MYISQLRIANFRQLRDVEIGPFREPAGLGDLIVLAGPNGSGKSSVLELLSFGIANRYSWQYYQSRKVTEHSFAVRIGLTQSELHEMEEDGTDDTILSYAKKNRGYWMAVNMPDAISPEERRINEQVHSLVSRKFQNFTRKLGFFLRADRGYGARGYDRRRLFDWRNRLQPNHFNSISFGQTTTQYEDMYDFLVEQSYHYIYQLGLHHKNAVRGGGEEEPTDPLIAYNSLLEDLFPSYSFVNATAEDLSLKVQLPTGHVLPFQDLSSGEKEVFFILSFFLRNDISDSIIIIDALFTVAMAYRSASTAIIAPSTARRSASGSAAYGSRNIATRRYDVKDAARPSFLRFCPSRPLRTLRIRHAATKIG